MGAFADFFQHLDWDGLSWLLTQALAVLFCLTVHETCHGLAAFALGDPTAKRQHRLSLNPLRHLDPIGALMMLVAGFGWAKPVPVDMRYFKYPKSGMAVTALAGPVSNFLLAFLSLFLYHIFFAILVFSYAGNPFFFWMMDFFLVTGVLSISLGLFNLIPFPPLDGSKVLGAFLPDQAYYKLMRYERFGMLLLVAVLATDLLNQPLSTASTAVFEAFYQAAGIGFDLAAVFLG
ncbi:site-2 protease family protein [Pseudoflavonifractor sp. 524-17]|uniref:site-2 protease family protein n=1 Tax=Pseudoflavonifractor sp. 524-17 TaxID=2304577 RepID=UPI00325BF46F